MKPRRRLVLAVVAALAAAGAGCGSARAPHGDTTGRGSIGGAGATFPEPLYKQWAKRFQDRTETTVKYDPVGSGGGIAQFVAGIVDFGATDTPMNAAEEHAAAKKGAVVHIPTVLGAVAVAYDLPGVGRSLRLDGATLAALFSGSIRRWNDRRIRALNPGVRLPGLRVTPIRRSDASGTTALFTGFLAGSSADWARRVGSGKAVAWPVGQAAARNSGVATAVRRRPGAVGYVALTYARSNQLATASIRNRAGAYVAPSVASTAAAAGGVAIPADLRLDTVDRSTDPGAYPIASATFMLVYQDMCKAGKSRNVTQLVDNWLHYVLTDGQKMAAQLQYAPLPDDLLAAARAKVAGLRCNRSPLKPARLGR